MMHDSELPEMDQVSANRFLTTVEPAHSLKAGVLSPMAGTKKVRILNVRDLERFLVSPSVNKVLNGGPMGSINYVDPSSMAVWIEEVLGDAELATALRAIIDSGRAYGYLVPEMKDLIAHRIKQCEAAMAALSA